MGLGLSDAPLWPLPPHVPGPQKGRTQSEMPNLQVFSWSYLPLCSHPPSRPLQRKPHLEPKGPMETSGVAPAPSGVAGALAPPIWVKALRMLSVLLCWHYCSYLISLPGGLDALLSPASLEVQTMPYVGRILQLIQCSSEEPTMHGGLCLSSPHPGLQGRKRGQKEHPHSSQWRN